MADIGNLIELDNMAKTEAKKYHKKRFACNSIEINGGRHFTGIVGARGIFMKTSIETLKRFTIFWMYE